MNDGIEKTCLGIFFSLADVKHIDTPPVKPSQMQRKHFFLSLGG